MIIVGVIFSSIYADLFWEGSSESIRETFFKLGVSRALSQLPLVFLVFLSAGLCPLPWTDSELKGKANRKQKST